MAHPSTLIPSHLQPGAKAESKFLTADGYRTHYVEAGDPSAPTLVLVHGGSMEMGMGLDRWYPTILPLAETFHVYAVDELGCGETDPPRDPDKLDHIRTRAEHVAAFIRELDAGPVYVVGQSMGGWAGSYITLKYPELVSRLVLVDSGSTAGSGWRDDHTFHLPYADDMFEPGTMVPKRDLSVRDNLREYFQGFLYDGSAITEELLDRMQELSDRWHEIHMAHMRRFWDENGWERKYEMFTVDGKTHIKDVVHKIDRPTLAIWGRNSNKGVDAGYELHKKIPGAEFHVFDKANHFVWVDQPHGFNSLVTWYLTRQDL